MAKLPDLYDKVSTILLSAEIPLSDEEMQNYQEIEEEGYDSRPPSGSNFYRSGAAPAISIDFVTTRTSSQYPSSNEGILTPQDTNSTDDPVRGNLSGAGYPERSEGSLHEHTEAESMTIYYHGNTNRFNAGLGTQFDNEGGEGSQTTSQVDVAFTGFSLGVAWNDENGG